ncbi:hypothetical protein ACM9HF_04590 [Colwellia sp. RE-S-Sl-9]
MKLSIIIFFVFLIGACASRNNTESEFAYKNNFSYSDLAKLHKLQSKTKKGFQYEVYELIPEHNKFWSPVAKKCRPLIQKEGIKSFKFIFVLNKSGDVIDARSELDTNGVNCFLTGIKQIKYPSPPYENWYEIVSVK